MGAPSEAGANKLDNPTRVKASHQHGTEPHVWGGNEPDEAVGMAVHQPQCESVKVISPEILVIAMGQGFHVPETSSVAVEKARMSHRAGVPDRGG